MTTTPGSASSNLPGKPPVVDLATWDAARGELLVREKAHTRDRVFLTYSTTGRGVEPANGSFGLLDMTPYGRREAWEDSPDGWPEVQHACWYWRSDADGVATWGPTSRPAPQWGRPGATAEKSLGRSSDG